MWAVFSGASSTKVVGQKLNGTDNANGTIYAFQVPNGTHTTVTLYRGSSTDNVWNNTNAITLDASKNYISGGYNTNNSNATWSTMSLYDKDKYLYLQPSANWKSASAKFEAYFYDGVHSEWVSMSQDGSSGYWAVQVPTRKWPYVIFVRMDPSKSAHDWNSKWNKTEDLAPYSGRNTCQTTDANSWNHGSYISSLHVPTMSSSSLVDGGTVTYGGDGTTLGKAYLVEGGTKIYVSGSAAKAVADPDATIFYQIYEKTTSKQNNTTSTYNMNSSSSPNTTYKFVLSAYAKISSTSGTALRSDTVYYKTVTCYTVTYDDNDATSGSIPAVSGSKYVSGSNVTLATNTGSLDKSGYSFNGWNDDPDGDGTHYDAGGTLEGISGNVTLYAEWSATPSLTVNAGTHVGTVTGSNPAVTLGNSYAISASNFDAGYEFNNWTASPVGNASFASSTSASTNVTVSNGSVTVTANAREKMTTVTINANPAGAGTFTVDASAFTPGNTTTAGVATSRTVVATPTSGKVFHDWTVTGNATGSASTNTYTLEGNGNAGTGTLTANFGIASGWYMEGTDFGGFSKPTTYQLTYPYRGMSGVYYIPTTLNSGSKYWKVHDGSKNYNTNSSTSVDQTVAKGTIYSLSENDTKSSVVSSTLSNIWVVVNTSGKKLWVQDPQTFHNVNVTNEGSGSKGTYKVTLKTTSAFTKGANVFETTQYANGETFTVTVTGKSGYIPTITIGGTEHTFWQEAATYSADGTMSTSDIAVSISYTASRAVRFAKTTGCKTLTATGPSSTSVSDNTKIKDGTTITFHQENNTGYTFSKWYSNNTGTSGTEYSTDDDDYELTVSSTAYTIYPLYTEDMHTVTLNSSVSGGHVEISSETVTSTSAGIATASPTITAVADSGYYFTGWTGDINSGVTLASGTSSSTAITIRATADSKSITANFDKRWIIAGDWEKDGGGSWVMSNKMDVSKLSNVTFASKRIDGLTANTDYDFKLYDLTDGTHWVGFASDGEIFEYGEDSVLVNTYPGYNIKLKTAAQGNYYFYYNLKTHKLNISYPASRQVTMGTRTETNGVLSDFTGGTISAVDNSSNVITNGLYIASGANITFTATPKAGYIWRGWYNSSGCTGDPVATERVHTDEGVTSVGFTRYGLFEEALYTVTVHRNDVIETTVKVGVDTHPTIMASTAPTGKVFDRWVTTGSATVEDPYSSTTTITGATDDASTVTATFKDLPKIYIDMTSATGWTPSNMYVVFYKNNGYFDENKGTGLSSTYVINATPLEMTRMGTSKIWYYSYDPTSGDFAGKTITCVAFVDHWFAANTGNFASATVAYRTDFSSCMNMFVVTDNTGTNKNKSCYYRNSNAIDGTKGYWRKYEENNSGFYLNNLPGGSVEFTNEDGGNTYTARVNLDANTTYYFYLGCCNGWNWSNNNNTKAFNSDNRTRMVEPYNDVSSDGLRCKLTTTAAGYYTFSLTPQNTRQVQLSVDFPVAANDYRAVYNNAASSPTISRPSNIIKSDQNSGTISLWLNKGTNYISFQKATLGAGGAVSWTACGSQQTVTGVAEAGIYTMTLTRDGSTYTVSTPEKYDGDLYIRTDCAPGKWVDYTENKLDENTFNFSATDPNSFDYYYCKWINDAGTNVRCVIANDINVALSDTLKGESILVSVGQPSNETLPEGANVRFSYNSLTNTLTRSYLTGASTDVFLNIIPDAASKVYKTDGTTDMYGSAAAKNKFSDLGNWVYELDVKVKPGATAAVKANYNSTSQELIAAGSTLLGGTEDKLYQIRLLYDFRTNYLMSAWMPSGDVSEAIELNSDIMIVRRGQNDANQLSFSGEGELTEVKRAYGVFEFNKDEMVGYMNSWSDGGTTYGLCMYYFSLPFDVNVSDIFGVGTMGDDWRIQFYNGKKRAEKGWFAGDGTTTFWEDVPADTVLYAYEGYLLMLNRSHFNNGSHKVWNNVTTSAYLYFPSTEPVYALDSIEKEITVPSHECKIDRFFVQDSILYYDKETKIWGKGARNHKYVDSHWNMMGTPLFRNKAAKSLTECTVKIGEADSTLNYVYEWVPSTNSLSARQVLNTSFTFKPMFAYMVQYSGTVTFEGAAIKPAAIAAHRTSEHKQYTVELELTKENQFAGRTYIELRENAVDSFLLNEDMYMMKGSKVGDIYTHAGGYEVAANVLTVNSHVVPVSVDTKSAGTYTISMPSNFSGTVTLVDKFANTRTNLGVEDYEIYLEKGTISDRFEIEININNVPTAIDGVSGGSLKDGNAHKFIMNDMLYILKDGVLYDARGARVK